jgi:hypothetical protein
MTERGRIAARTLMYGGGKWMRNDRSRKKKQDSQNLNGNELVQKRNRQNLLLMD